jgi:basic membrane lipoprotein Med (substrate-binding protein (PBP1-ABC) superfamily)
LDEEMRIKRIGFLFATGIAAVLAACSGGGNASPSAETPTAEVAQSPTPTSQPYAILIALDSPLTSAERLAAQAAETFFSQEGWRVERVAPREQILDPDMPGSPSMVVTVGSGFGDAISAAAQAHPEIRFVAVEEKNLKPFPNLLVVGGDNIRQDEAAFMAGMLASIENRNEYIGWIGESGTTRGKLYTNGFIHGVRYICPRCRVFPYGLDPSAGTQEGMITAGSLQDNSIDTASAIPGPAGDAALVDLAQHGVRVAGAQADFYDTAFSGGTVNGAKYVLGGIAFRPDLLLADLLPRFCQGEVFTDAIAYSLENGGLEYAPFPNDWISVGRQQYLQNVLADLASGRLDTGVNPQTGDEE